MPEIQREQVSSSAAVQSNLGMHDILSVQRCAALPYHCTLAALHSVVADHRISPPILQPPKLHTKQQCHLYLCERLRPFSNHEEAAPSCTRCMLWTLPQTYTLCVTVIEYYYETHCVPPGRVIVCTFANTRFYVCSNRSIARMYLRHYSYIQLEDYQKSGRYQAMGRLAHLISTRAPLQDGRDLFPDRAPG